MVRALLLEDDGATAERIVTMLRWAGHCCDATDLGSDGLAIDSTYDYDILLLDLDCATENARVLRQLKGAGLQRPVLTLAALDTRLRVLGLGQGECLAKPFTRQELLNSIDAVANEEQESAPRPVTAGVIAVDLNDASVEVGGRQLHLTAKEYGVLRLLALHKGSVMTKEYIHQDLYGGATETEPKIIDVFVCKLRKKLAKATGGERYIETVWGRGYVLHDPGYATSSA